VRVAEAREINRHHAKCRPELFSQAHELAPAAAEIVEAEHGERKGGRVGHATASNGGNGAAIDPDVRAVDEARLLGTQNSIRDVPRGFVDEPEYYTNAR
jgi:hypothetical protein